VREAFAYAAMCEQIHATTSRTSCISLLGNRRLRSTTFEARDRLTVRPYDPPTPHSRRPSRASNGAQNLPPLSGVGAVQLKILTRPFFPHGGISEAALPDLPFRRPVGPRHIRGAQVPCRSLRHAVYAALLHFGLESAVVLKSRSMDINGIDTIILLRRLWRHNDRRYSVRTTPSAGASWIPGCGGDSGRTRVLRRVRSVAALTFLRALHVFASRLHRAMLANRQPDGADPSTTVSASPRRRARACLLSTGIVVMIAVLSHRTLRG
jgi:hypothetical protein